MENKRHFRKSRIYGKLMELHYEAFNLELLIQNGKGKKKKINEMQYKHTLEIIAIYENQLKEVANGK